MKSQVQMGIIGDPIAHSVSPQMHQAAIRALDLQDYRYDPISVTPGNLESFMEDLREEEWLGVNVTIPHKEAILSYLDELDADARHIGAVNLVLNRNGKLIGKNTDWKGFLQSLRMDGGFIEKTHSIAILGAGGSARAISYGLLHEKFEKVTIINRSGDRARKIAEDMNHTFGEQNPLHVAPTGSEEANETLRGADCIINATPVGMFPQTEESPLPDSFQFPKKQLVIDIIYNPLETVLLRRAREQGAKTLNGIGMLVYQGMISFQELTGEKPPAPIMRAAAEEALHVSVPHG